MELNSKYRIIEKVFEDGHKEYVAQESRLRLFGRNIFWKDYVLREDDYYGNTVRWICCGNTYDECVEQLKENLESKERSKKKNTIVSTNYHNLSQI